MQGFKWLSKISLVIKIILILFVVTHIFSRFYKSSVTSLEKFIYFIVFIKVLFILLSISHLLSTYYIRKTTLASKNADSDTKKQIGAKNKMIKSIDVNLIYFKGKFELLYKFFMSCLLILVFNPWYNVKKYTSELTTLFLIYGIVQIVTLDWGEFLDR